ncbi:MAG: CHASE2 domain-containing protein [Alphaproteobacteria bacterium]
MIARLIDRLTRLLQNRRAFSAIAIPVAVAAFFAAVAIAAVDNVAVLTSADRFISDYQVAALTPPEPQDEDIVIVSINEDTLAQFPYRSPLDRAFLAKLLRHLESARPRAIGVDYLFDQPTETEKDTLLRRTLHDLRVPLVVAYTDSPEIVTAEQHAYLNNFVPSALRAYVTLATDQFDQVRWVFPGAVGKEGRYIPSFPRALAAKVGVLTPEVQLAIAWHGRPNDNVPAFRQYPAHLAAVLPPKMFEGKIILIGSDITLVDRHLTPYTTIYEDRNKGMLPGVVIQAHALSQLLGARKAPRVDWLLDFLIALAAGAVGAGLGMITLPLGPRVAAGATAILVLWGAGIGLFHYTGVMFGLIAPTLSLASSLWAMEALSGHEARRQRAFIQGAFSRYVSPKVVERLIEDPAKMSLQGERRVMTYVFTDIAGFTTMSELLESKELSRLLNSYLDGITEIILKMDGMVDKYIGDAVFAIFNAPVDLEDHAEQAVRCALEVDRFCEDFRKKENACGIPLGVTRIGVHTGPAVIGNFGSRNRFTYTAEGDAVNTASRLEGVNKHFGTRISVSDATRHLCRNIRFRPIASVILKGKTEAVRIWEPLDAAARGNGFLARYCDAFDKLERNAPEAMDLFATLKKEAPDDPCVELHLTRLRNGARGIEIVMTEK